MLDSDNGSKNVAYVRFYQKEVQNQFLTNKENRPIYEMRDFVRIEIPGRNDSIIDTYAGEHHKQAYPEAWARYQNDKRESGEDDSIRGTLLKEWSLLTPAQAKELRHYNFYTVEQVANASDAQLSPIRMIVGMGEHSFREKAKSYLAAANGASLIDAQKAEVEKRDSQISDLQSKLEEQQRQMAELMARLTEPTEKPKRGRPVIKEAQ